jgi:hypothetical protein
VVSTGDVHANGNLTAGVGVDAPGNCNLGGYVTAADFRSNGNVYVPNGYVNAGSYVQGNFVHSTGNLVADGRMYVGGSAGVNWYDNGGYMWSDNTVRTFGLLPTADNNSSSGLSGTAWAQVATYWLNNVSDPTLKRDVAVPGAGVLAKVMALPAMTYRWKAGPDTERRHWGFMADDVARIMGEDFGGYLKDPESGIQGIGYADLTAVLWQAVQELSSKIDQLEKGM